MNFEKLALDVMERVIEKLAYVGDWSTGSKKPTPSLPEPKGVAERIDKKLGDSILNSGGKKSAETSAAASKGWLASFVSSLGL